jgi:broad specificity phosphatase PhoE
MSSLLLVRHGQASAHAEDYDVLSDIGARQASITGSALAKWVDRVDAVYRGPRRRHRDTLAHLTEAAAAAGLQLPEPTITDELDEMEVGRLFHEAMDRVLPTCPDLREQLATQQIRDDGRAALKHLGGVVSKYMERWASGEDLGLGLEPFDAFTKRVQAGLHHIMKNEQRGRRVLVVTSGGPISVAVRLALGVEARRSMALLAALANASLTELRYTEHDLSVEFYNHYSHLLEERLVTRV